MVDIEELDERVAAAGFGEPLPVLDNLYLVRVPLPDNPLKVINSYFILDDDGTTTIVDVGFNHPDSEVALNRALASLGRSWDKVQIVLTHSHPDHTGNLDRILDWLHFMGHFHEGLRYTRKEVPGWRIRGALGS
ncbi:MBL fold metallo-hydrolase, partial [Adlercreutzia caecimuris]|uniref:MBL fold metallo-hydrolase n=1 Tax=Adlercreutzia caecimuris TaxID=671266 RepID=UPI002430D49A